MVKRTSANTFFTVADVAREADVTRQTVYNWIEADVIRHSAFAGTAPIFTAAELAEARKVAEARRATFNTVKFR